MYYWWSHNDQTSREEKYHVRWCDGSMVVEWWLSDQDVLGSNPSHLYSKRSCSAQIELRQITSPNQDTKRKLDSGERPSENCKYVVDLKW